MLASFTRAALVILAGATGSLVAGVSPAFAQHTEVIVRGLPPNTNMRLVSFRDLNLNLVAHREILNKRVERAVRRVCESRDMRDLQTPDYRNCANKAWAGAWPQINRAYVRAAQLANRR